MPTYQYACTSPQCDLRFERVQAFTDPAISECPDCGERVRKVYGSVGVVFKGSGFYRNDSRDARVGGSSKSDSDGSAAKSSDAGKGEAAKSDSGSGSASGAAKPAESGTTKSSTDSSAKTKAAATTAS